MTKEELEKENAELKCECRRCVYTDSPCILSDYGKDINGICDHFKDVFDENAELKLKLEALEGQTPWKDIKDKSELIKENAQLKNEWQEQVQKATDEGYARTLQTIQLTKAKELLKDLLSSKTDFDERRFALWAWKEEVNKAEQFLKENEK